MLFFSFFENCRIFALLLSFFLSFAVSFQTIKREKSLCEQEGGGGMTFKYSSKKKNCDKINYCQSRSVTYVRSFANPTLFSKCLFWLLSF